MIVVTALYECDRTMRLPRGAADSIAARKVPIDEFIPVLREPVFPRDQIMRAVRYPELARRIGLEGNVIANIFVAADGSVTPCIDMTDNEIFNAAVLDALQTATFKPALDMDGKPVGTWLTVPIRFHLD